MADFLTKVQTVVTMPEQPPPGGVGAWAVQAGIKLDRGPFSFKRHEFLEEPYADEHPQQVDIKATQSGNTTEALLSSIYAGVYRGFVGVLYLFPSAKGVGDFSRTRVSPLFDRNPDTIGKYVRDTDAVGVKRIKDCNLLFRGVRSKESIVSDPVDRVVVDEKDLMPEGVDDIARERLAHSDFRWWKELSNPSIPDFGVDKTYKLSDGRRWLLRCPRCNGWTDPVSEWERNAKPDERGLPDLIWERKDGSVVLRCMKCREGVLDPAIGQWVAQRPGVTAWRGRQYSQLFSQYVPLSDIVDRYLHATSLQAVYNFKLGLAYIESSNRLSEEEVLALCGSHGVAASDPGPCYIGVDQGKHLHTLILRRDTGAIVHLGVYKEWEELDPLIENFHIARGVVDGMPEARAARDLAKRHVLNDMPKIYLCQYDENMRGDYAWNDARMSVKVNRTESLDGSQGKVRKKDVFLPKQCEIVEDFARHMHNTAKKLEDSEKNGVVSQRYVYVKLGPDHFAHAYNYACIAAYGAPSSYFDGADLR
ncbi:MAG: phage terminase large subunit family protein [Solidesulfovibrio sp.]|uniref:phage terminase large subunit family protein n=1 Tax=Solidesulfovibrio sp. TaxID=2910990 RepID=UPI002B20547D|nr:phage terminase large subunit family protein [Solidesulfovibrio sp.]MEA4857891.1 phage terminase large subunit family protein [Solidesulfovibrio sp.]